MTSTTNARFSIVMPVYNAQSTIERAIKSVCSQTLENWELIAVNDGSIDDSLAILNDFARADRRVIVLSQNNLGPGAARNRALKDCVGEYIAFLDSDDYWEADYLERVEEQMVQAECDVVFVNTINEYDDGHIINITNISNNRNLNKDAIIRRQMTGLIPWGMEKVFRRCLLTKIRGDFTDLEVGEESVFSFEIVRAAKKIGFVTKPIYHYINSNTGQHRKGGQNPWLAVVRTMSAHLQQVGEFERYKTTINSFALRSLCIAVYRISSETYPRTHARHKIAECFDAYEKEFDFSRLDRGSLDRPSVVILALLRLHLYGALVVMSKVRKNILSK